MTDYCPTCGAAVRVEVSGVTNYMVPVDAERVRELEDRIRELEALLDLVQRTQRKHYGHSTRLHLAMIGVAEKIREALEPLR